MAVITDAECKDLVAATLKELGRMKWTQAAQALTRYEVMSQWLKQAQVLDGGVGIQRTINLKTLGAAQHVGKYEDEAVNFGDTLGVASAPWVHAQTNWVFDRTDVLKNKGKSLIVNILQPRRENAMLDMAAELEAKAWSAPSATDAKLPYGIMYYVVKNAAAAGFNGGAPTGFTTVAGINPTTEANWKNYTFTYTRYSKDDLIAAWRTAYRKIDFKSPIASPNATAFGEKMKFYTNETVLSALEKIGEAQNENLGRDLIAMPGNMLTFKGNPIVYLPILDADATSPLYGINHDTFFPYILEGDNLREGDPDQYARNHNMFVVWVDLTYNYICVDRRRNFVAYKV